MKVTLTVPDELESHLQALNEEQLSQIFELALRRKDRANVTEFEALSDVLETLAELPTPEEVLEMRPSAALQCKIDAMKQKISTTGLSSQDQRWWEQHQYVEHLVRIAKAEALLKLKKM